MAAETTAIDKLDGGDSGQLDLSEVITPNQPAAEP